MNARWTLFSQVSEAGKKRKRKKKTKDNVGKEINSNKIVGTIQERRKITEENVVRRGNFEGNFTPNHQGEFLKLTRKPDRKLLSLHYASSFAVSATHLRVKNSC